MFLDSIRERQEAEERQRKEKDGEEVRSFKECVFYLMPLPSSHFYLRAVAARTSAVNNPPPVVTSSVALPKPKPPTRKEGKKALKGVVMVKKKTKLPTINSKEKDSRPIAIEDEDPLPDAKRRKVYHS